MPVEEESIGCHESIIISNIRGDMECITQHDSTSAIRQSHALLEDTLFALVFLFLGAYLK